MSYTTANQVQQYLAESTPRMQRVCNQRLTLQGDDYNVFFNGSVDDSDVVAKSIQSNSLTRLSCLLADGGCLLSALPLVAGSVVVASDSSLGRVFTENYDYIIDYPSGKILVKAGGSLAAGQTVCVWFKSYTLYQLGTDYQLRPDRGEIRRLSGGNIASGEEISLDYTPISNVYNETIVTNAVIMANGLVEREVDPDGAFGADPTLQAAATFRALEIICQTSAVRVLSRANGQDRNSGDWIKLAEAFARRAEQLLRGFHPPFNSPTAPKRG
jgi:hypothetical protein